MTWISGFFSAVGRKSKLPGAPSTLPASTALNASGDEPTLTNSTSFGEILYFWSSATVILWRNDPGAALAKLAPFISDGFVNFFLAKRKKFSFGRLAPTILSAPPPTTAGKR